MSTPKSKKESVLELAKFVDMKIRVKCLGGRELTGILKGFDELVNIVLDECEEFIKGECFDVINCGIGFLFMAFHLIFSHKDDNGNNVQTRKLGLAVVRGPQVSLVSPEDGTEEISNPFLSGDAEES